MRVTPSNFTVAEYCQQLSDGQIVVNPDYQRSPKVWPAAARSYLIDTLLLGYPMPKLTIYQRTDLNTRITSKEIVDGQQRSMAICNFIGGRYRLSIRSPNAGRRFTQLEDDDRQRLLEYQLSVDVLVAATPEEIRELFRRINSYTVPLNRQEVRHATFQGDFKWFVVDLTHQYATSLKAVGVFTEAQLTRMSDGELAADIILAILKGIRTASPKDLTELYEENEQTFPDADDIAARFRDTMSKIIEWNGLHSTALMKPYNFYSLFLALAHALRPVPTLQTTYARESPLEMDEEFVLTNLGLLNDVASGNLPASDDGDNREDGDVELLDQTQPEDRFADFRIAIGEGTNTETNRKTRFMWFSRALENVPL